MRELELDPMPRATLEEVAAWFWDLFPKRRVVMGGGTVLAARWRHRRSTDVDLFYDGNDVFERLDRAALRNVADDLIASRKVTELQLLDNALMLRTASGWKLSLFPDQTVTGSPLQPNEEVMGLRVHTTLEILRRKMHSRIFFSMVFKQRDFHDFAVCALEEPDVARALLGGLKSYRSRGLADVLEDEPEGFRDDPLLGPFKYPWLVESEDLRRACGVLLGQGVDGFLKLARQRQRQVRGCADHD